MATNVNHVNFDQRLTFIKSILKHNDLETSTIEPIEYDENCPFPYNNFIYLVKISPTAENKSLTTPGTAPQTFSREISFPGTSPLPEGTTSLIIRLTNADPGTDLNNTNRVENEVATMKLVREAFANTPYSKIVPQVYAWSPVSSGQGFTILQHMPGNMLGKPFEELLLPEKRIVLDQMVDILSLMQNLDLPATIESLGGLTFGESGLIISAQMTAVKGGPFVSYEEMLRTAFWDVLVELDKNPIIDGWKAGGVRERLNRFLDIGLKEVTKSFENTRKVIIHSDFTTYNLLFDLHTYQITALLDFDFACISTPAEEFLQFSFSDIPGVKLPSPQSTESELLLRNSILTTFPTPLPISSKTINWETAQLFHTLISKSNRTIQSPHTIPSFSLLSDTYWLLETISPFPLTHSFISKKKTEEEIKTLREDAEGKIIWFLEGAGY